MSETAAGSATGAPPTGSAPGSDPDQAAVGSVDPPSSGEAGQSVAQDAGAARDRGPAEPDAPTTDQT